jgi:hypothetical protein
VKIRRVVANARASAFQVQLGARVHSFPFTRADPRPTGRDPVEQVWIDPELAREGFCFRLASGKEGTILGEQVLEYNDDPALLRDRALYFLTIEAQARLASAELSKREVIRRLGTSASQFYRLLDQTNYRKSVDQMLALLHVLGCDVEIVVRKRTA